MSQQPEHPKRALGLAWQKGSSGGPKVLAKGQGPVAQTILDLAAQHGIPIQEDPDLLELLSACEVGDEIPSEVYGAVARLLAFLWGLRDEAEA